MLRIIIASRNPVKIQAAKEAFEELFGQEVLAKGVSVPSGISDQPLTNEETLAGACNRATNARTAFPRGDYWVGLEGGVHLSKGEAEAFGWAVVLSADQSGKARSASFCLPEIIAKRLQDGEELGPINDELFHQHNSKQKGGAVGILTNNVLQRTMLYRQAIILALIPFVNRQLYL